MHLKMSSILIWLPESVIGHCSSILSQIFNIVYRKNVISNKGKSAEEANHRDAVNIDVNELETMLPTDNDSYKDRSSSKKNHKINGEICLLTESPYRILRVSAKFWNVC